MIKHCGICQDRVKTESVRNHETSQEVLPVLQRPTGGGRGGCVSKAKKQRVNIFTSI